MTTAELPSLAVIFAIFFSGLFARVRILRLIAGLLMVVFGFTLWGMSHPWSFAMVAVGLVICAI